MMMRILWRDVTPALDAKTEEGVGTWRKCGEAWKSDVNDGGADIRCDRWLSGNRRKSSFVDFFGENLRLPESERWLTEPCRVLEAFWWDVFCQAVSLFMFYVLTKSVPLNNVVVTISLCEMLDWRAAVLNIKQGSPTWCILNFHFDYLNTSLKTCVGYFCDWLVCQMRGRWQCQGDRWKWTGRQWEGKKVRN